MLFGLKALLPGLDEGAIIRIVEKTKAPGFNPHDLEEEIGKLISAVKAAKKWNLGHDTPFHKIISRGRPPLHGSRDQRKL